MIVPVRPSLAHTLSSTRTYIYLTMHGPSPPKDLIHECAIQSQQRVGLSDSTNIYMMMLFRCLLCYSHNLRLHVSFTWPRNARLVRRLSRQLYESTVWVEIRDYSCSWQGYKNPLVQFSCFLSHWSIINLCHTTFIFDRYHRHLAVVTPGKYKRDTWYNGSKHHYAKAEIVWM